MAHTGTPPATRRATARHRLPAHTRAQHASGPVYRPRRPTATPLYPAVQHHLESFLVEAEEADPQGFGVASWVERDFRAYLRCGILAHGFARARCVDCGQERLVPFSCKVRGACPSCNARRMAEVAAHVTDHVLPHLAVRQWVLSLPKRLCPFLHHDAEVASAVLRILIRALRTTLRRASPGAPPDARLGAISFPQRFGSSLNPHYHFHVLALDGVFREDERSGEVRFHEATDLTPEDWQTLERAVQRRVLRAFHRHGLLGADAVADMLSWQASGGFSIDASVHIEGEDRAGVERLVRYCARPPLALERLHAPSGLASLESPEARLIYRLPEPDLQGRTVLVLTPLGLLARLSRLLPPPRVHRQRYHGVLAPHARLRARVVAIGREARDEERGVEQGLRRLDSSPEGSPPPGVRPVAPAGAPSPREPARATERTGAASRSRALWALLLARIYEVLPLLCPACGGR